MDQDDVNRFGTQRAAEVAAPLITELADRLGLDLDVDERLVFRVLVDFTNRMFAAGYNFGAIQTTAEFMEQLPPGAVNPVLVSPRPSYDYPLGEGPEWDEPAP